MNLKERIRARAAALGFAPVGFTTCDPPPHLDAYRRWVAQGHHGEMAYLSSERNLRRRADLREILPDCQSVVVLGVPYAPPPDAPPPPGHGRIAAYALHEDYHDVLKAPLQELAAFIHAEAGLPPEKRILYYTDTGAILERDLGQRAGLGWIGKNSMLINPQHGSYFLLAELLLPLALEPDPPFPADRCGSCTRCIDACPTQAILPGQRTLDARRCISYLTIELKGSIPADLRPGIGDRVFGCDICQQVCPWNRFARPPEQPLLPPRRSADVDLIAEWTRYPDDQTFNRDTKGTPLRRSKRHGYLRNVLVALGNSGERHAIPLLQAILQSEADALLREHAAWALDQLEKS